MFENVTLESDAAGNIKPSKSKSHEKIDGVIATVMAFDLAIGKPGALVIAIYNNTPGGSSVTHSRLSTDVFFSNPAVREFPNPMFYIRESWLAYMTSHSHDPLPSDPGYAAHIAEVNTIFDCKNVDGLLRRDVVTKVYSESI